MNCIAKLAAVLILPIGFNGCAAKNKNLSKCEAETAWPVYNTKLSSINVDQIERLNNLDPFQIRKIAKPYKMVKVSYAQNSHLTCLKSGDEVTNPWKESFVFQPVKEGAVSVSEVSNLSFSDHPESRKPYSSYSGLIDLNEEWRLKEPLLLPKPGASFAMAFREEGRHPQKRIYTCAWENKIDGSRYGYKGPITPAQCSQFFYLEAHGQNGEVDRVLSRQNKADESAKRYFYLNDYALFVPHAGAKSQYKIEVVP